MRIALIDPFFDESHKRWAEGYRKYSRHQIKIYSGSPHNWKWKMTGGTLALAKKVNSSNDDYDLFLVTDMLNLPLFKSLLEVRYNALPFCLYFHENQITYPWSPADNDIKEKRDYHYGFINFCSAVVSDRIFFNSDYHKRSFLDSLPGFMNRFPEGSHEDHFSEINRKSSVLPIGLNLPDYQPSIESEPTFIWNHRWEFDKNPDAFFNILFDLKAQGISFKLIVVGKSFNLVPEIFITAKEILKNEILHFGFTKSKEEYFNLLKLANILLVTSYQDFFGISIVEAIAAGCYPVLPDRLAYREHVAKKEGIFYKNEEELMDLMMDIIKGKKYHKTRSLSDYVRKYEWSNLIDIYDSKIKKCVR